MESGGGVVVCGCNKHSGVLSNVNCLVFFFTFVVAFNNCFDLNFCVTDAEEFNVFGTEAEEAAVFVIF